MTDKKNEVDVALKVYTKRIQAENEFTDKHFKIFLTLTELKVAKEKAEKELKIVTRAAKEGAENKQYTVVYIPKWKKWYDLDAVYNAATPTQRKLIDENCLVQTLDKVKFEEMIKSEDLPRELKQKGFREEEMTAAVSIKTRKEEK